VTGWKKEMKGCAYQLRGDHGPAEKGDCPRLMGAGTLGRNDGTERKKCHLFTKGGSGGGGKGRREEQRVRRAGQLHTAESATGLLSPEKSAKQGRKKSSERCRASITRVYSVKETGPAKKNSRRKQSYS